MADQIAVVGGVDTHTDFHQAAVIDSIGRHLATQAFPTTPDGYHRLLNWLRSHGEVIAVGVEGTGPYGAQLTRVLRTHQVTVIEVDRPDWRARRANGKSDTLDAYAAAVLSGRASATPKNRDGIVEAIRTLIVTAPDHVRERLRTLHTAELIRHLARSRPGPDPSDPACAARTALRRCPMW
ncbi:IS110 family transposase [Streptomyces sp. NBC_01007]|nr:IS110 family transposase [Streptomyces sp. NBC_01007]